MRNITPLLLSISLMVAICVLASLRFKYGQGLWSARVVNPDMLFVCLYLLWMLIELKVSRREVNQGKETSDCGTCELYAAGQALTFLSALWFGSLWTGPGPVHVSGISIFAAAVCYRLWAIRTLGRYYSHKVRKVSGHRIIDSGPYRFTRHPAYAGMIAANLGIVLYFFNLVTLGIFLLLLVPAIVLRIFVEEKTLFEIEGYPDFARHRKRIFPALW